MPFSKQANLIARELRGGIMRTDHSCVCEVPHAARLSHGSQVASVFKLAPCIRSYRYGCNDPSRHARGFVGTVCLLTQSAPRRADNCTEAKSAALNIVGPRHWKGIGMTRSFAYSAGGLLLVAWCALSAGCTSNGSCRGGSCGTSSYSAPSYSSSSYSEPTYSPGGSGARSAPVIQGSGSR